MSGLAIAGGIAAGAGSLLSSVANAAANVWATKKNIETAKSESALSRNFERQMASSQYQRAIEDMKAAGINPGSIGASLDSNSVPSAAAATGAYAQAPHFENMFSSAVAAAMANDKNITRKITQEMRDETALQVQRLRNEGLIQNEIQKKAMNHKSYNYQKRSRYDDYDVNFESL